MAGIKCPKVYLYLLVAVPLAALVLHLINPSLSDRTQGYIHDIVKVSHGTGTPEVDQGTDPSTTDAPADAAGEEEKEDKLFTEDKWPFQADVEGYDLPKFDIAKLRQQPPHNYEGPGHPTFATFYASRNATLRDPYFVAAQQIVYRLLWDSNSKSSKHPVTVFVAPFVPDEQRQYFEAAGAIVRELGLRPFEPLYDGIPGRWQDMFSKLEMWRQTDFSRIAYLDSDAFPLTNCDSIFDAAPEQKCKKDLLEGPDRVYASSICDYVFAGHLENSDTVNGGVLILKPDRAMYDHLVRASNDKEGWDTGMMEQALLSHAFRMDGPFPPMGISKSWNAFHQYREEGIDIYILHDKMWAHYFEPGLWPTDNYKEAWTNMLALYESDEFVRLREEDRTRAFAD